MIVACLVRQVSSCTLGMVQAILTITCTGWLAGSVPMVCLHVPAPCVSCNLHGQIDGMASCCIARQTHLVCHVVAVGLHRMHAPHTMQPGNQHVRGVTAPCFHMALPAQRGMLCCNTIMKQRHTPLAAYARKQVSNGPLASSPQPIQHAPQLLSATALRYPGWRQNGGPCTRRVL